MEIAVVAPSVAQHHAVKLDDGAIEGGCEVILLKFVMIDAWRLAEYFCPDVERIKQLALGTWVTLV